jgi:hypothetical protein
MAKSTRKKGLPKALEQEALDDETRKSEPTMEEFVKEMHGEADKPQDGLPSLEYLKEQFQTKSAAIRFLVNQGFEVKAIAKHLGIRYQHARNVANTELKRGPNEDWRKPLLSGNDPDLKHFKPETK